MRDWRTTATVVLAAVAVAAGVVGVSLMLEGDDSGAVVGPAESAKQAPYDGWRWESYQTIEIQVPEDWKYGTTGSPPCLLKEPRPPYVGRPGAIRGKGCRDPYPELAYRASYLWFDAKSRNPAAEARLAELGMASGSRTPGVRPADHGWIEETRSVDGVLVTVLSDDDSLRQRILDSARVIDGKDFNGCTPDHPLAHTPQGRPAATDGLASIGSVESIAVCRYAIAVGAGKRNYLAGRRAPMIGSSMLTGKAAQALVDAITAAPDGSGPNEQDCLDSYGSEVMVLTVHGTDRDQEVLMRYNGCHFNGTDDGETLRQLTSDIVQPLLTGIHWQSTWVHPVYELAFGPQPPKWR